MVGMGHEERLPPQAAAAANGFESDPLRLIIRPRRALGQVLTAFLIEGFALSAVIVHPEFLLPSNDYLSQANTVIRRAREHWADRFCRFLRLDHCWRSAWKRCRKGQI
jgi:hypothetical protein